MPRQSNTRCETTRPHPDHYTILPPRSHRVTWVTVKIPSRDRVYTQLLWFYSACLPIRGLAKIRGRTAAFNRDLSLLPPNWGSRNANLSGLGLLRWAISPNPMIVRAFNLIIDVVCFTFGEIYVVSTVVLVMLLSLFQIKAKGGTNPVTRKGRREVACFFRLPHFSDQAS